MPVSNKKEIFDAAKGGVEKAKQILAISHAAAAKTGKGNRPSRPSQVAFCARIMLAGKWQPDGSNPAVITVSNILKEGEHRLKGFILAAETDPTIRIEWWFRRGIPDDQAFAIQTGSIQHTAADILQANGLNKDNGPTIKFILNRGSSTHFERGRDVTVMLAFGKKYESLINDVRSIVKGNKVGVAQVWAAVCRGYIFHVLEGRGSNADREAADKSIRRFCAILSGDEVPASPHEMYPFRLNQYFKDNDSERNREECYHGYQLTELALQKFIEKTTPPEVCKAKQAVLDCRPMSKEVFPLAGEPVLPTKIDKTPAFIVPVQPMGHKTGSAVVAEILSKCRFRVSARIGWKQIPKNTVVVFYLSSENRIKAVAKVVKTVMTPQEGIELVLAEVEAKDGAVTTEKLVKMSTARKFMNLKKIGSEVTRITVGEAAMLAE